MDESTTDPIAADVSLLISKFSKLKTEEFSVFVKVWKELAFPLVYWIGDDDVLKVEFVESLLEVGVCYTCQKPKADVYSRIGALYLLYSIYCTQPPSKSLVRLTLPDRKALQEFHSLLRVNKYRQAEYVLQRLKLEKAFRICCTLRPMCISHCKVQDSSLQHQLRSYLQGAADPLHRVKEAVEPCMEEYEGLKEKMAVYLPQHLAKPSPFLSRLQELVDAATRPDSEQQQEETLEEEPGDSVVL